MESVVSSLAVPLEVCSGKTLTATQAHKLSPKCILAAVFFATYDTLKRILPTSPHLAPVNHMLSATIGEVVRDSST